MTRITQIYTDLIYHEGMKGVKENQKLSIKKPWVLRRGAMVARAVVMSAAVTLLVLAVAGPDALVARWNVDRLRDTGKVDVGYLRTLSADAVPELARLPEPYRDQTLGGRRIDGQPLYAVNLARVRARVVLGSGWADRPARTSARRASHSRLFLVVRSSRGLRPNQTPSP